MMYNTQRLIKIHKQRNPSVKFRSILQVGPKKPKNNLNNFTIRGVTELQLFMKQGKVSFEKWPTISKKEQVSDGKGRTALGDCDEYLWYQQLLGKREPQSEFEQLLYSLDRYSLIDLANKLKIQNDELLNFKQAQEGVSRLQDTQENTSKLAVNSEE